MLRFFPFPFHRFFLDIFSLSCELFNCVFYLSVKYMNNLWNSIGIINDKNVSISLQVESSFWKILRSSSVFREYTITALMLFCFDAFGFGIFRKYFWRKYFVVFSPLRIFSVDINQNVNNNTGGKTINIFSAILSIGASLNNFLMKPLWLYSYYSYLFYFRRLKKENF